MAHHDAFTALLLVQYTMYSISVLTKPFSFMLFNNNLLLWKLKRHSSLIMISAGPHIKQSFLGKTLNSVSASHLPGVQLVLRLVNSVLGANTDTDYHSI